MIDWDTTDTAREPTDEPETTGKIEVILRGIVTQELVAGLMKAGFKVISGVVLVVSK
jgi:hypothetical protein